MKHEHPRHLNVILIVLLMLTAFLVGYQAHGNGSGIRPVWAAMASPGALGNTLDDSISLRPVQLFQEAFNRVQTEYVTPVTNTDELTYAAIRGMLAKLNDPYTRFMDPTEFAKFNSDNRGFFAGIGATLNMTEIPGTAINEGKGTTAPVSCPVCGTVISDTKQYRVTVVEPMPKSPAEAAGLQPDDYILKVDDMATDGLMIDEVVEKIRGPEGTKVTLTLARKGIKEPIVVSLTRANIEVPAVESKILNDNIGYLRLHSFNEKTVNETRAALMDFNRANVRGILLDLRNDPGGLLFECIKISSMFLPAEDKVIVSTRGRDGQNQDETRIGQQIFNKPMVVLVNKGSASASEILTGALKDYKRATVIGESTFGKALVQTVIRLSGGSAMAVTTAHYYTPSGFDLNKKGITPDKVVELDKDAKLISEKDNQALAAIRILNEEMAKGKTTK